MGGADCYCALCGGPLGPPYWEEEVEAENEVEEKDETEEEEKVEDDAQEEEEEEDDLRDFYDPTVLKPDSEKMEWLSNVRLVGENPDSASPVKVFLSGLATSGDFGMFDGVEAGDDPNFFAGGDRDITAYSWESDNPIAFPFHQECYQLLCKAIGVDDLDKEAFYETIKGLASKKDCPSALDINYGPVSKLMEQYWVVEEGTEYTMFSPIDIPDLADYCKALPTLDSAAKGIEVAHPGSGLDPFNHLSTETQLLVVSHLDMPSVARLQAASRAVYNIEMRNSFWRRRLWQDMPWLEGIFEKPSGDQAETIDWALVYKDLHVASRAGNSNTIHGLVNRRRIWEILSPQITQPYLEWKAGNDMKNKAAPATFEGATSTKSPRLVLPEPKDVDILTHPLVREFWEVSSAHPVLEIDWTSEGQLAGLRIQESNAGGAARPSRPIHAQRTDQVAFPDDDWITGLVIKTREDPIKSKPDPIVRGIVGLDVLFAKQRPVQVGASEGDRRLLYVTNKRFIVAIKTVCFSTGQISRISFLQQPCNKVYKVDRVIVQPNNMPNIHAMTRLWYRELPPSPIRASEFESGYWAYDIQPDTSAQEALVFGPSEEELADITALSADLQFGGLMVTYGERPSRTIGPRLQALTTLKIDGRGGERIVTIQLVVNHIPSLMRFVTNRGRQLVLGHGGGGETIYPPALNSGDIPTLGGVYGWWSARESPKATLHAVGCLFDPRPAFSDVSDLPSGQTDSNGFHWDPAPPPSSVSEFDQMWGQGELKLAMGRSESVPAKSSIVRWLDCRRPIAEVRAVFCHSTVHPQIPLCTIALIYADGDREQASAGPDVFPPPPTDTDGTNGHHWCWCAFAHKSDAAKAEIEASPHYQHEKWEVGSKRLRSLRIWLSEETKLLVGVQFTSEDQTEGPVWTREAEALGEPSGEICFTGSGGGEAIGLKLFFDDDHRSVSRDDSLIVALQALKAT